jgi:hypothetical protein
MTVPLKAGALIRIAPVNNVPVGNGPGILIVRGQGCGYGIQL